MKKRTQFEEDLAQRCREYMEANKLTINKFKTEVKASNWQSLKAFVFSDGSISSSQVGRILETISYIRCY